MPPKKLDSGGQGQIYEVDKDTVYKVVKFSDHYKELSELAILHSLPHPCIIRMKKWDLNQHECKIHMERMYSNMYDFSKKATFEKRLEIFPNIFWTMVRVARFFQKNGIMNCDIKSENVMLSRDGSTVKIIDFGHMISDGSFPVIGTRSYQPPELWTEDEYSYKSMVWSIGISCLEFLYRIHPIVDIIYGDDSESEASASTSSHKSSHKSRSKTNEYSDASSEYSYSSTNSDDEYRQKYTNLFEILMEEGESLPFRHRLEKIEENKDKIRVINNMLERMLTYDRVKRISLDDLYHHRIFDNIRGPIKDELVLTKQRENLFCDRELTPVFMSLGRKLYRDEIMFQAYMLLSIYIEKRQRPSRREFVVTSMACMDIMSYVFSMVPSSRDLYRNVVLTLRKISEFQVFERVIEILKSVQFNIFYNSMIDTIRSQDNHVLFPLLLELVELEAESGKKQMNQSYLLERYMSSGLLETSSSDEDEEEEKEMSPPPPPRPSQAQTPKAQTQVQEQNNDVNISANANANTNAQTPQKDKKSSSKPPANSESKVVITEYDLDPMFLTNLKEQIRLAHQEELICKKAEEEQGDLLIITL